MYPFNHVRVSVTDLEKTIDFYRNVVNVLDSNLTL